MTKDKLLRPAHNPSFTQLPVLSHHCKYSFFRDLCEESKTLKVTLGQHFEAYRFFLAFQSYLLVLFPSCELWAAQSTALPWCWQELRQEAAKCLLLSSALIPVCWSLYPYKFFLPSAFPFPHFCPCAVLFDQTGEWAQPTLVSKTWKGLQHVSDLPQRKSSSMGPLSRRAHARGDQSSLFCPALPCSSESWINPGKMVTARKKCCCCGSKSWLYLPSHFPFYRWRQNLSSVVCRCLENSLGYPGWEGNDLTSSQNEGPVIQKGCIWGPAKSANDLYKAARQSWLQRQAAQSFMESWVRSPLQRNAARRSASTRMNG